MDLDLLSNDERNILSQALTDYSEGVEDCDDNELKNFLNKQIESISRKLNI
jgi:hypothetical protein